MRKSSVQTDGDERFSQESASGASKLLPLLYEELTRIAHRHMRQEGRGHTLETGALLHEAFMRLSNEGEGRWKTKNEFLAIASGVMRQVLIDHIRRRRSLRRGGDWRRVSVDFEQGALGELAMPMERVAELDISLEKLAELSPEQARLVQCHVFGGMTLAQVGELVGKTEYAILRDWKAAHAWLKRDMLARCGA